MPYERIRTLQFVQYGVMRNHRFFVHALFTCWNNYHSLLLYLLYLTINLCLLEKRRICHQLTINLCLLEKRRICHQLTINICLFRATAYASEN